jgi:hypothetical protein
LDHYNHKFEMVIMCNILKAKANRRVAALDHVLVARGTASKADGSAGHPIILGVFNALRADA